MQKFHFILPSAMLTVLLLMASSAPAQASGDDAPSEPGVPQSIDVGELLEAGSRKRAVESDVVYSASGPWGQLEYYAIHLMAPVHYLEMLQPETEATVWVFGDYSLDDVWKFLDSVGIDREAMSGRQRSVRYLVDGEDVYLYPSFATIGSLTPPQRAKLAEVLSKDPRNPHFQRPVIIDSLKPITWFQEAGLSQANAELMASLCYTRSGVVLFSDLPYVLSQQREMDERNRVLRAATRTRSLVVRLNIGEGNEVPAMVDYWNAGHKKKAILPILESVSEVKSVERIDIGHLLPPVPRMLLNTYPSLSSLAQGDVRDSHWTCRNFFSPVVTDVVQGSESRVEALMRGLEPAEGDPGFGDTLIVYSEKGEIIHSMTYVAADIVFTKNGSSIFQPWVLMHYDDVMRRYSFMNSPRVEVFRARNS